jgi:hypothetical protein
MFKVGDNLILNSDHHAN